MRYPEFLNEKDTIGFVSPSFGCAIEPYKTAFEAALSNFKRLGYSVDVGPNSDKSDGIGISTKPEDCGREFMEYYTDKNSKCLISCGGGELMCETIDYIDFEELKKSEPKWFMGYSDNTNMTFLLATLCDVPYSTLKNTRARGGQLAVDTIEQICRGLGITMAEFFTEGGGKHGS